MCSPGYLWHLYHPDRQHQPDHRLCRPGLPGPCRLLWHRGRAPGVAALARAVPRRSPGGDAGGRLVRAGFGVADPEAQRRLPGHRHPGLRVIVDLVFLNLEITGGPDGLPGIPPPSFWGLDFRPPWVYLILTVVTVILVLIFTYRLVDSYHGRALRAIRDHEITAQVMGINTPAYKVIVFTLAAAWPRPGRFSLRPLHHLYQPRDLRPPHLHPHPGHGGAGGNGVHRRLGPGRGDPDDPA